MDNQIIGNVEYGSIKEKAYINGTADIIRQLAKELDKAGILYSGRVNDYRSAVTVEKADRAAALELMRAVKAAEAKKSPEADSTNNIFGNTEYRYIKDKRYVKGDTETILRVADRLNAEKILFSGRRYGDNATITVSGDEMQAKVKGYFAEEKERNDIVSIAYMLSLASDGFEDGYYISEVNTATGEEISPYRSKLGDIPMFLSVDEALRYAQGSDIELSNTEGQLNEWRRIEAEKAAEEERQLNLARSREIIKRLPVTEQGYDEYFVLRENAADWIYFDPDGADGEGQFYVTTLYEDDIMKACAARLSETLNAQSAFIHTIEYGRRTVISADTSEFEKYALSCINSRNKDNIIVSTPIISGNEYSGELDKIIDRLENHFDTVRSYKENRITDRSDKISVEGHIGTWYVIDSEEIEGKKLFLLEHETYGDEAANIIIDENKNLVMEDVWNGFDDYRDSLDYDDGKQSVSRDFAAQMWQHGLTVYINDRDTVLSEDYDNMYLFQNSDNHFFALDEDVAQERFLHNTVTVLNDLNSAAMREAAGTGTKMGTIADYAKDMYADGKCAYVWRDDLTEQDNISASIRSGDTAYIDNWLHDLRLDLPYLEENQNISIEAAWNNLDNFEKQYMGKSEKKDQIITEKENPSQEKYVSDENLSLSEQLYELAKRELADYENSLDTAEKAKAAAYELTVKRDILSYIENDLSADISDSEVENACRRLISTGYPLDTFYQDWLKNEYDNRMEAIRMTADDTFKKIITVTITSR